MPDESSTPLLIYVPLADALDVSEMSSFVKEGSNNKIHKHVDDGEVDLANSAMESSSSLFVTIPVAMNNDR